MHDGFKRVLQLSTVVIVKNLNLGEVSLKLKEIRGFDEVLERVENIRKIETQKKAISFLLQELERFDDKAYDIFVIAASESNEEIAKAITEGMTRAVEELQQDANRRQQLIIAHSGQPQQHHQEHQQQQQNQDPPLANADQLGAIQEHLRDTLLCVICRGVSREPTVCKTCGNIIGCFDHVVETAATNASCPLCRCSWDPSNGPGYMKTRINFDNIPGLYD